jgi:hypothetical protein
MHSQLACFHPVYFEHQLETLWELEEVPQGHEAQPPGQLFPVSKQESGSHLMDTTAKQNDKDNKINATHRTLRKWCSIPQRTGKGKEQGMKKQKKSYFLKVERFSQTRNGIAILIWFSNKPERANLNGNMEKFCRRSSIWNSYTLLQIMLPFFFPRCSVWGS